MVQKEVSNRLALPNQSAFVLSIKKGPRPRPKEHATLLDASHFQQSFF